MLSQSSLSSRRGQNATRWTGQVSSARRCGLSQSSVPLLHPECVWLAGINNRPRATQHYDDCISLHPTCVLFRWASGLIKPQESCWCWCGNAGRCASHVLATCDTVQPDDDAGLTRSRDHAQQAAQLHPPITASSSRRTDPRLVEGARACRAEPRGEAAARRVLLLL